MRIRELEASQVVFTLALDEEEAPIKGNAMASGDDSQDRRQEEWTEEQLNLGNLAAWCTVVVTAEWRGFSARDTLGCCSYENEEALRADLYETMKAEALAELNCQIRSIVDRLAPVFIERDLAEQLYVNLVTSQFVSRVDQLTEMQTKHPTKVKARQLGEAKSQLQAAQDDARVIFDAVLRGEVAP